MKNWRTEPLNRRGSGLGGGVWITCGGFTLLEVIMGLALVSLLFGGIYGIANASVDLGRSVSENRLRETRASGLVNLLRGGLGSLPPGCRLELPAADGAAGRAGAVRVVDAPGLWAWSGATGAADAVAVYPEAGDRGTDLILAHLRVAGDGEAGGRDVAYEVYSRAKLVELEAFWWEFFDAQSGEWVPEWGDAKGRPRMAAVHFSLPGDPGVRRHVIAIAPEAATVAGGGTGDREAEAGTGGNTNEERGGGR